MLKLRQIYLRIRLLSLRFALSISLLFLTGPLRGAVETPGTITTAAGVRRLPPDEAKKELAVSLRAVVTFVNASTGELFVQDRSAGIFVFVRTSTYDQPLRAGQFVEVNGVTAPGDFSSSITKARITVIGNAAMPGPSHFSTEQLRGGQEDSQWGHLTGMVRTGREVNGLLYLSTIASGATCLMILKEYPHDWAATLVDSKISVDGVLAAIFNNHRQVTGTRIFIPSAEFVHIDEPAPRSAFDLPLTPALSVGAFQTGERPDHRIRVRATVTAAASDHLIYVSQEGANLAVELWETCPSLEPGAILDVVGFPGSVEGRPGLQSAVCRFVAAGQPVTPVDLAAAAVVPAELLSDGSGLSAAKASVNDLRLIRIAGTVIHAIDGAKSQSLTLADGDKVFTVTIPHEAAAESSVLEPGTRLIVAGVCVIAFDDYQRAQSFRLLARDRRDITVVSVAPLLTLRRALWLIGPLLAVICGSFIWIFVLRHHVRTKTVELLEANERLRQLTIEDALTGAANRRRFDEVLRFHVARARQTGEPLSLVMVDLDHFKKVNDRYGHQRGDQALIQVAGALRKPLPGVPESLVARYGGEEFAVLLPGVARAAAAILAEELRECVYGMALQQTISLGVATLSPESGQFDADALVRLADGALYRAKASGRNRVVVSDWDEPGDDGGKHSPLFDAIGETGLA